LPAPQNWVPHPFAFFLAKGWEAKILSKMPVILSESAAADESKDLRLGHLPRNKIPTTQSSAKNAA
jgi:hypothetical protein